MPDDEGRLPVHKFVAEVAGTHSGTATVAVAPQHSGTARLVYGVLAGALQLHDGAERVTFEVCSGFDTQYNGGFVVDGPRCVTLLISASDEPGRQRERTYGFGVPTC